MNSFSVHTLSHCMYIDGQWISKASGGMFPVYDPANGERIAIVPNGGEKEARWAVDAAHRSFAVWSETTAQERSDLLKKWHDLLLDNKEEIAALLTREQGKPLTDARGEVDYAASFVSWYAEEARRVYGETIPASVKNKRILVLKQPIGVVAAIIPWNYPAAMFTRKVAPALAAGCTIVLKPAEYTPLTALKLAELAEDAGIPEGVINVVTGNPQEIGETWLKDARVRKITFTGSTGVGKLLMRYAADTVKKVSLELGGHAPSIVFADADLDKAAKSIAASKFRNGGQTCICTNRIYVEKPVIEPFLEKFKQEVSKMKVGRGDDPEAMIGPLIDEAAYLKVRRHVEDALAKGAILECGGNRIESLGKGYFFEPTILSSVKEDMLIMSEETFGPVAPVLEFTDRDEVIRQANDTPYGLAAYIYTENLSTAIKVSEKLEYGIVGINDGLPSTAQAPFGGFKESGIGREGGHYGIDEFLEVKYLSLQLS